MLVYYAIIASIVIGAAIGRYAMCHDLEFACWGALGALCLATRREVLGETDHHSPVQIIADARGGHKLVEPEV